MLVKIITQKRKYCHKKVYYMHLRGYKKRLVPPNCCKAFDKEQLNLDCITEHLLTTLSLPQMDTKIKHVLPKAAEHG